MIGAKQKLKLILNKFKFVWLTELASVVVVVVVVFGFSVTTGGRSGDVGASGKSDEAPENNEKVNESELRKRFLPIDLNCYVRTHTHTH